MSPAVRRGGAVAALALAGALCSAGAAPAAAQGACRALFNGVEADQVASLSSPLVLTADDTLDFSGVDDGGTRQASVSLLLGPLTLGEAVSAGDAAVPGFAVSLDLSEVATRSVGLLRVRAATDNCTAAAWLRVGGRLPLTTSAGLAGIGLTVAGLAWLGAALVARRAWSPWVAAACGPFTGTGLALLAQQFGRLQVSYWSLGACAAVATAVGLVPALVLRWKAPAGTSRASGTSSRAAPSPQPAPSPEPAVASAGGAAAGAQPAPDLPSSPRPLPTDPFWAYVLTDVEVLHLHDYGRVVATLRPGSWYLVKAEKSGWARVEADPGVEGWVPSRALHREQ